MVGGRHMLPSRRGVLDTASHQSCDRGRSAEVQRRTERTKDTLAVVMGVGFDLLVLPIPCNTLQ